MDTHCVQISPRRKVRKGREEKIGLSQRPQSTQRWNYCFNYCDRPAFSAPLREIHCGCFLGALCALAPLRESFRTSFHEGNETGITT